MVEDWNRSCKDCGYHLVLEPEEISRERFLRGPSLGALLFTQGWAVGGRLYLWFLLSLIPIVGIVALVVLTLFGRRWSWKQGGWASWEEYKKRMRMMDVFGVVWVLILIVTYFLVRK